MSRPNEILFLTVLLIVHWTSSRVWCHVNSKSNNSAAVAGNELIFSHIIFRHGDRNPNGFYPTDPFRQPKYWKGGPGQLTDVGWDGKQRLYKLGKFLRKRYINLLNSRTYSPDLIYVRSSQMDRTIESATAAMAGFFGQEKWNDTLQSAPVNVVPREKDTLLFYGGVPCPRYDDEYIKFTRSTVPSALRKYQKLLEYLGMHTQFKPVEDFTTLYNIHDTLFIEKSKNLPLKNWTRELFHPGNFAKDMEEAVKLIFKWGTGTKLMARLRSGFLIREMLERFTAKSKSTLSPNYSFYVYSCHDTNMFNLLKTLKIPEIKLVPYGACILFELYKPAKGDYYVQLFYKNTTAEVIHPLNIPGCGAKCSLENFHTIYKDVIPTENFQTECQIESARN